MSGKCIVPGCERSPSSWKRDDECKGRKPFNFRSQSDSYSPKFLAWRDLFTSMSVKTCQRIYVCDIHFQASDFYPSYRTRYLGHPLMVPPPEHLMCAQLRREAVPSLFLDKTENLMLKKKAKAIGVYDWWRLSENYDEKLDLDQLVNYNKSVTYKVIREPLDEFVPSEEVSMNSEESFEHTSLEPVYDEDSRGSETVCLVTAEEVKLEVECPEEVKLEEESPTEVKKKLRLFRRLCTCPLRLPKHWAVHAYIEDNFMIISKETFSQLEGFVVERALRVTSDMRCADVHVKGCDVTELMQDQPLSCLADLEKLVQQVDTW